MQDPAAPSPFDAAASMTAFVKAGSDAAQALLGGFAELAKLGLAANPMLKAAGTARRCCDIPPPCWMPKALGEIRTVACAGGTASIRIRVTNCQPRASTVQVAFAAPNAQTSVTPASLALGPMERGSVTASVSLPGETGKGQQTELLLWVHGCNSHYLRWTVVACEGGTGSCHEIEVDDCTDPVHHWYDHFYCGRACTSANTRPVPAPLPVPPPTGTKSMVG